MARCIARWLGLLLVAGPLVASGEEVRLADSDRVVLIGSTLMERAQASGYWEALLTSQAPDRTIQFRNLGWSGDTVGGDARAGFETAKEGYRRLVDAVLAQKPTVLIVGYGAVEAFDGEAGLPRFRQGLATLLDDLARTDARLVLLAPMPQEDLGRPLPDPSAHNANLARYRDAVRAEADRRGAAFLDLFAGLGDGPHLTDNGLHLTPYGYWRTAWPLAAGLGLEPKPWRVELDADGKVTAAEGVATAEAAKADATLTLKVTDRTLPPPPRPADAPEGGPALPGATRSLVVRGLAKGAYVLQIDGEPVAEFQAGDGPATITFDDGPAFAESERLRQVIRQKNRLFFDRWRPQNETYLYGFRKHEQGQNAREIPKFDPLIADLEARIATMRAPRTHTYTLKARPEPAR